MNELQLIRSELAAQRRHAREIAAAMISQREDIICLISDTYIQYFLLMIGLESQRVASHLERLRSRSDLIQPDRRLIEHCAEAFETLAAERAPTPFAPNTDAAMAHEAIARKADSMTRLSALAEELEGLADARYGLDDWRRTAHLDADSILAERALRKKLLEHTHGRTSG